MMDRYDSLELDLECDGGGVAHKASLFGGMFKKSVKSTTEHSVNSQDSLSVSSDLSQSNDSLTENNNYKDKSVFKGMFKKTTKPAKDGPTQATISLTNPELSASTDSLTDKSSKDKAVVGVPPTPPPKPGHLRRASQDFFLDFNHTSSNGSLTEHTSTKESGGMFSGMFKKSPKPADKRRPSQDNLSTSSELSGSQDSLTVNNTKEGGGMFSGMFKKSPKIFKRSQSQDELSEPSEPTEGQDSENTKEKGGLFSGVFKKPKGLGAKTQSQEDLTGSSELSGSKEELSENNNTKEKGGLLSGVFKKPKLGAKSQSKDDLTGTSELSDSQENLTENTKEKGGLFGGVFKKPIGLGAKSQSQDDLSENTELSGSSENLTDKQSKGVAKILKNPFTSSAQEKDKIEKGDKTESTTKDSATSTEKPKSKQNGFSAMMMNTFYSDKQEKTSDSDTEEIVDDEEKQPSNKQQSKFAGAMTKLNPFRTAHKTLDSNDEDLKEESDKSTEHKQKAVVGAKNKLNPFRSSHHHHQKDSEDPETLKDNEKREEEKHKAVKNNVVQWEKRDRSETIMVPNRLTEEEIMRASRNDKMTPKGAGDRQVNKDAVSKEKRPQSTETPVVPPRPTQEEMNRTQKNKQTPEETVAKNGRLYPSLPNKSDDEALSDDKSTEDKEKTVKVKRPKHHNPFMPRTGTKLASVETAEEATEAETVETSTQEENEEEESNDKAETKAKKPKRRNPFMPQVKGKVAQKRGQGGAEGAENEGGNRSLFDQLEDFRFEPSQPENSEDADNLMEWWNTVDNWEDTPQTDDMTPKEEAKAFAVTAEKIQKGIRVFNKLFSERAESLWQHVIDLNSIADGLDKFNKKTKIAQITGGSTSAIGGVATIAGLALAPVTMGTSLIVTAVGLGVATAGGLTSAGAGISNQVNNSMDRKKVEKIVEDYQEKMVDLNKALKFIKQGIENLRRFDLIKMKKHAYNRDFPVLNSNFYEDGAMAGKAILINANEIMRVVQIANVAGSTAARAVQIASMATGVLTGLFVGMDIYFVAKDSKELKKGAKSEFAATIREVAQQLHDGLVELNSIREELQTTTPDSNQGGQEEDGEKKEVKYDDDEEEDEIDRIKKQIKKDYENREWV